MAYRTEQLPWGDIDLDGHAIPSSITPAEKACLQRLAAGRNVLEIGSGYGYSTIVLAKAAIDVTAVDPHAGELPGTWPAIQENLSLHRVATRVVLIRDRSEDALPVLIAEGWRYGFVFVDGCHEAPTVEQDVHNAFRLLADGGRVAVHDYNRGFPEVARVCDEIGDPVEIVDSIWVGG